MLCLNLRALFSRNVSGHIQEQSQINQAAFTAEKITLFLPYLLVFHINLWRDIQTQHGSYQLYSFLTLVVMCSSSIAIPNSETVFQSVTDALEPPSLDSVSVSVEPEELVGVELEVEVEELEVVEVDIA